MATRINIRHKESGIVKKGYYGFSWTYLIFGWFVPLLEVSWWWSSPFFIYSSYIWTLAAYCLLSV